MQDRTQKVKIPNINDTPATDEQKNQPITTHLSTIKNTKLSASPVILLLKAQHSKKKIKKKKSHVMRIAKMPNIYE